MPHPRTIRAWLRRGNLVLVLLLLASALIVLTSEPERAPLLTYSSGEGARDLSAVVSRPVDNPTELLALVHRFHPHREAPQKPAPQAPTGATRLPLRAFQVAMVVRLGPGKDTLMLRSKDPSRDEVYLLRGEKPGGDAKVLQTRYEGSYGYFLVQRGDASLELTHRFNESAWGSGLRRLGKAPVAGDVAAWEIGALPAAGHLLGPTRGSSLSDGA